MTTTKRKPAPAKRGAAAKPQEAAKEVVTGEDMTAEDMTAEARAERARRVAAAMKDDDRQQIRTINAQAATFKNAGGAFFTVCAAQDKWAAFCKDVDEMAAEARAGVEDRALERIGYVHGEGDAA